MNMELENKEGNLELIFRYEKSFNTSIIKHIIC